jgi:Ca-activated chloride channel family protein
MPGLTFERPIWLLLLILAVPTVWVGLRWLVSMSLVRRWSAVVARVLLIALVAGMLAGASMVRRTDRLAVIGIVDVSGSVERFADAGLGADGRRLHPAEAARMFYERAGAGRGPDDLLGIVVFDGRALAIAAPTRADISGRTLDVSLAEGTDIAAALRYAAAMIPPDAAGRLVLMSDGNETGGSALSAAEEVSARRDAGASSVPIDVIPLAYSVQNESMVSFVDAPPAAADQATITVRVGLRSTDGGRGTLQLLQEGEPLDINGPAPGTGRAVMLPAGEHVELVTVRLDSGRIHRFEAVYEPELAEARGQIRPIGDSNPENNRGGAFTITPGKGSVLILDGVGGGVSSGGSPLASVFLESGLEVQVMPPSSLPEDLLALQAFDLVILENVPVEALNDRQQRNLVAHVQDMGGGLVMVGGPDSFGAGGWKGSVLEPILPVRLDLPEKLITPEAAIVLVLDSSGSMRHSVAGSTRSQQQIANEAAALAVKTLDKGDYLGVIEFNSMWAEVVPMGRNTDGEAAAARIMGISPGGGTNIGPALAAAHEMLAEVDAKVKHVILLTDGSSGGRDELPGLAFAMRQEGIRVSAIAVGDHSDKDILRRIADDGGGIYYEAFNPNILPKIFLKAIRVVRTPLIRETPFMPQVLPVSSPLLQGITDPPRLGGMVLTQARPEPTITLAMAAPSGEPLLAHWNVELGKVAAFTSDAHRWASRWLAWPGYRQMWTQIARTIGRAPASRNFELRTEVAGDDIRLRLEASGEDGRPVDLLSVPATVYTPSGDAVHVSLSQTGPGLYEASLPAPQSGNYVAVLKPQAGATRLAPVIGGASVASGLEYRRLQSNIGLLRQIADRTGGRVLSLAAPDAADLFDRTDIRPSEARTPIWRSLLLWTLFILLLDVGTRRIAWDRYISSEFGADWRQAAAEAVKDRGEAAARTLGRLRRPVPVAAARVAQPTPKLDDKDAARVAQQQAAERQKARLESIRATREKMRGEVKDAPPAPPKTGPKTGPARSKAPPTAQGPAPTAKPPPVDPDEGGLKAAKRRARERFDQQGD